MRKQVALPGSMTFRQWVNELNFSLLSLNIPVPSEDESKWKEWVYDFLSVNPKVTLTLPYIDNWKLWTEFFINDINLR